MSIGTELRMRRIIEPTTNSTLKFAFSRGTSVPTVVQGIEDSAPLVSGSHEAGIVAKVTATATRGEKLHRERLMATVEHCAELGVDDHENPKEKR